MIILRNIKLNEYMMNNPEEVVVIFLLIVGLNVRIKVVVEL